MDAMVDIAKASGAAFGELDFGVDALKTGVGDVGLYIYKGNDARPVIGVKSFIMIF